MVEKVTRILASKFILRRSGTYQKQFHRNYTASASFGMLGNLTDMIESSGLSTVTPTLLANSGSNLLTLEAGVRNLNGVALPGGWNDKRGIFILLLEISHSTGGTMNYFIQGYTDSDSFTDTAVDYNMRMYVNNVITATPTRVQTQSGAPLNSLRLGTNFQTVIDHGAPGGFSPNSVQLMRPQDVFGQMKNADLSIYDCIVTDRNNIVGSNLLTSRRRNSSPGSFASAVFNGYAAAYNEQNRGDFTTGDVAEHALGVVLENDGAADKFLRHIRESNNLSRMQAHFTYGELVRAVQNIEAVRIPIGGSGVGVSLNQAGDSQHFAGQTDSTVAAVQLATTIPTLMLECMLSSVTFTVSNMVSPVLDMVPGDIGCFAPEMTRTQFLLFRDMVMTQVFRPMCQHGKMLHVEISCSFHSEIVINIRIGDDPETRFVAPAFCDSLFAPVVTSDPRALGVLSNDLNVMCSDIASALANAALRKDQIISRSLTGNLTGALGQDSGRAFTLPQTAMNVQPLLPHMNGASPLNPFPSVVHHVPSNNPMMVPSQPSVAPVTPGRASATSM